MPGPMGGGRRRQMGAKPKVKNPGKILGRILGYTFKNINHIDNRIYMYYRQCTCKCTGYIIYSVAY